MDIVQYYDLPELFKVEIHFYYKGIRILDQDFFEKNPGVLLLYPAQSDVLGEINYLRSTTSEGKKSVLKVSEAGIERLPDALSL